MPMRRVLVMGGHGFIGRWLVAHLRRLGDHVVAPTRITADLQRMSSLQEVVASAAPDVVINLAAVSSVTHHAVEAFYEINLLGHLRLLQAISGHAPTAQIFLASTANLYGQGDERGFSERDVPAPRNHYAMSKLGAEQLHQLYPDLGSACAVRPFNCIGRGQRTDFVVPKLVDAYRRRLPELELGTLEVKRDFVDVRDVCGMWEALLAARVPPPIVNFGNGEAVSLSEVVVTLQRLSGHNMRIKQSDRLVRPSELTYQRADTETILGLGYRRRHSLVDSLAWMLEEGTGDEA